MRRLLRRPAGLVGLVLVVGLMTVAVLGPALVTRSPTTGELTERHLGLSRDHPLGTDFLGRDHTARLIRGARTTLGAAVVVVAIALAIALAVGVVAGYAGGITDSVLTRMTDVALAFPSVLLALAIAGFLGPGLRNAMIALVATSWSRQARIIRAVTLSIRRRGYVDAAVASGGTPLAVVRRHVLPNLAPTVIVLATLDVGVVILSLAALSFLGLGNPPPAPEWGRMLLDAKAYLESQPLEMLVPGAAIAVTVLAFTLVGDALRDLVADGPDGPG